jgi:hypothetical protein
MRLFDAVTVITRATTLRHRPLTLSDDLSIKTQTTLLITARPWVIDALTKLLVAVFTATHSTGGACSTARISTAAPARHTRCGQPFWNLHKGIAALLIVVTSK